MRLSSNNMNQLVNLPQLKMSWGKFIGTVGLFGAYPDCSRKRKNVNQSMVGQLDKEVYQRRSVDLGRTAELMQAMVQEPIEKVVVTAPEHVEIVWKFKDEVRNFIGI